MYNSIGRLNGQIYISMKLHYIHLEPFYEFIITIFIT